MASLTLWLPGWVLPGGWRAQVRNLPRLPCLEMALARGRVRAVSATDSEATLFAMFGVSLGQDGDAPIAAITHHLDFPDGSPGHGGRWLRVDPVCLKPDRTSLVLLDSGHFALSMAEARRLVEIINAATGSDIRVGRSPARWYLPLPPQALLHTTPLARAVGCSVEGLLPRAGDHTRTWHRWMNEVQMVLHDCAVNGEREARGDLPVNSVWLWGSGALPPIPDQSWDTVVSDMPLAQGLARCAGALLHTPPITVPTILGSLAGTTLVALSTLAVPSSTDDQAGWIARLQQAERNWLRPLLEALRVEADVEIILRLPDREVLINGHDLRRWWRRPHHWAEQL